MDDNYNNDDNGDDNNEVIDTNDNGEDEEHDNDKTGYCITDVSNSSGLAKTILQGKVKGGRRQVRQRKRWEDNIREWTGPEFAKFQRAVENREKWRKLVVKSSVVSKRP